MAHAYNLCTSPSFIFHDCRSFFISISSASRNLNLQNYKLSSQHASLIEHAHSPEDANLQDPDAKFSSLSKTNIWVNPKRIRAKEVHSYSRLSLLKVAKSLDSCNTSTQHVSEMLNLLGDKILVRDAVFILDNMVNPETALLALEYFQHKIEPARRVVLYNVTLKLFREIKDFERAEKLFDEMLQRGLKPNVITFSTIISCAAMCSLSLKAVALFEKMPSLGIEPDENLSSSMIYAYARTGNSDVALKLYDRAKRENWHIETVAFSALIKMFGMSANYDGCLSVYKDMKLHGVKPNMVTYSTLLYAMGRAKWSWEAKAIYEDMINYGFSPNWATYAALLQAYSRARFGEDALGIYNEMKDKGMDLNPFLYNMLLDMCADVGYIDEAVEIFEDMKNCRTCQPDIITFSSMINMYSRALKVSEAEAMLNEMIAHGFEPNIFVITSLIHCYGKAKRTDDVVKIFNQLLDSGFIPDDRFCGCLLYVMTQTPKEGLGKITDCVQKANPKLGSVVRFLVEKRKGDGYFRKEASQLLNSIGTDVKKSLCNSLIDLCVNLNMSDRACDLLHLGLTLRIYRTIQSRSERQWSLYIKRLSHGAAKIALHVWINDLAKAVESGEELPPLLGINTGIGNHKSDKGLASVFESHLKELDAPFHEASDNAGWLVTTNVAAKSWLQSRGSTQRLML
ncbi:hypothetical protein Lal_00044167 [Lupinus albus]|uniref:Putative Smr domain, pentacotripeptide-repeat region of PRORP n=1 Tax=Lupinus albus TaxID=3870 RepID=A0A6A5PCZ3_LUPAL|nr:putative Smr domain, pentacotripeptide-repeat region of PRORP [Lupinus albus]KAF1895516.1 hypothetical protein Lal_00044167 [Lupinus albus]